jgi:PhnB protein
MPVNPIPPGHHTVTPYLTVRGADRLLDFVKRAFAATERELQKRPDGTIRHAEVQIGDSMVMIAEARGEWKPIESALYLYVKDTDATYRSALKAGATSLMEPADQFYGDRNAGVKDPVGNVWWIGTHVEDVPPAEMARRAATQMK